MLFGRRGWDQAPAEPAGVLLASAGTPFSGAAIRRACELSAGQPVAVLTILKVYGSSFGLPNPGLLPTRRERDGQYAIVRRAIAGVARAFPNMTLTGRPVRSGSPWEEEGGRRTRRPD